MENGMDDPTRRFTDRVEDYERYRPHYPDGVIRILRAECGLEPSHQVADIGSGTGLLSVVFLRNGNRVFGVEPNEAMRAAGEAHLREWPGFHSIIGRAEATTLPAKSVDFVTAASALHWFDPATARPEFRRILRPGGWLVVVGNRRSAEPGSVGAALQEVMQQHRPGDAGIRRRWGKETLDQYYGSGGYQERSCPHQQVLDWSGLQGLMQSYSSMPRPGQPGHEAMIQALRRVFDEFQEHRQVTIDYNAAVCFGML